MMSGQTPAGWYPDPGNNGQQRYWDGAEWTENYAPVAQDPPPKKGAVPTVAKVLIGVVGVLVLFAACAALISGGSDGDTPTAQETQTQAAEEIQTQATDESDADTVTEEPASEPTESPTPEAPQLTRAQENAIGQAQDYLDYQSFSRSGLIEQLEFEGYSTEDATFAVANIEVNWNEQAAKKAEEYLDYQNFSRSGLIEQLEFEGFTTKQATYGVNQTGL